MILPPHAAERYGDLEFLACGAMGEVYKAWDRMLERHVVIKIIRQDLTRDHRLSERFRREVRALAALRHKHVVRLLDYDEGEGLAYFTMEYVEGENLDSRIKGKADGVLTVVAMVARLADGLAAVHEAGIVHRDVKPRNIMVTTEGTAKLIDFGVAKQEESQSITPLTGTEEVVGSLAHIAPEVLLGQPCTPKGDVYALGVVLYEALTGKLPIEPIELLEAARERSVPRVAPPSHLQEGIGDALDAIVCSALAWDPGDRTPSAESLRDACEEWLEGSETQTSRASVHEPIPAPLPSEIRYSPGSLAGAGLVAMAVLGLFLVLWRTSLSGPSPEQLRAVESRLRASPPRLAYTTLYRVEGAFTTDPPLRSRLEIIFAGRVVEAYTEGPVRDHRLSMALPWDLQGAAGRLVLSPGSGSSREIGIPLIVPPSPWQLLSRWIDAVRNGPPETMVRAFYRGMVKAKAGTWSPDRERLRFRRRLAASKLARTWREARPFVEKVLTDPRLPLDRRRGVFNALQEMALLDSFWALGRNAGNTGARSLRWSHAIALAPGEVGPAGRPSVQSVRVLENPKIRSRYLMEGYDKALHGAYEVGRDVLLQDGKGNEYLPGQEGVFALPEPAGRVHFVIEPRELLETFFFRLELRDESDRMWSVILAHESHGGGPVEEGKGAATRRDRRLHAQMPPGLLPPGRYRFRVRLHKLYDLGFTQTVGLGRVDAYVEPRFARGAR